MKIGIDMDEIITEFVKGFLDFYNSRFKTDYRFENWTTYNFWEILGGTREEAIKIVDEFYLSREFDNLKLVEGSKKGIYELYKENELVIVTSRPLRFMKKTNKFLSNNFPDIKMNVFYSDDFHKQHSVGKAEMVKREGLDFFIEDNLDYAKACSEAGARTFLLNKPWNQGYSNGLIRVSNWNEILYKINELNKLKTKN